MGYAQTLPAPHDTASRHRQNKQRSFWPKQWSAGAARSVPPRYAAPDRPGTVRYTNALTGMERSGQELPACLTDRLPPALPVTGRYRNHHSRLRCRVQREGRQAHDTCTKPRQANAT